MSKTEVIPKETEYSSNFFVSLLGRISINPEWPSIEGWERLIAISHKKGLSFVATKHNQTPGISIYKTRELLDAAKELDTVIAPVSHRVKTTASVNLIQISPQQNFIALCQSNSTILVYEIDKLFSETIPTPYFTIPLSTLCHDLVWIKEQSFVCLTEDNKASEVNLKERVTDWIPQESILAFDVFHDISVWVASAAPSRIYFSGKKSVDLTGVFDEIEDKVVVVNGVRILRCGMLVASVVLWNGQTLCRHRMKMVIVKWNSSEITLHPDLRDSNVSEDVEDIDPVLSCPLSVNYFPQWSGWLVSCSDIPDQPHCLVLDDSCQFLSPEKTFVWPLKDDRDNLMLGVGIDLKHPIFVKSEKPDGGERKAVLVVAATEDGTLMLSALAKESPDMDWKFENSEEPVEEIEFPVEVKEARSFSESAAHAKLQPMISNQLYGDTRVSPSVSPTPIEAISEVKKVEEKLENGEESALELVEEFERHRLDHIQYFRQMKRLTEMTRLLKLRTVDLFLKGRQEIEKLEKNEIDFHIQQQTEYFEKLKKKIICSLQVMEHLKLVLCEEDSVQKLRIDAERTLESLQQEQETLERKTKPVSEEKQTEEDWMKQILDQERTPREMKDRKMEWIQQKIKSVRNQPILTTARQDLEEIENEDQVWKLVSEEDIPWREFQLGDEIPEVNLEETETHILQRERTEDGSVRLQWIPQERLEKQQVSEDEASVKDSVEFEICSEDEIEKILQERNAEVVVEDSVEQRVEHETEESQQQQLYLKILQESRSFIHHPISQEATVRLKPGLQIPTLKEFLSNLGRPEEEKEVVIAQSSARSQSPQISQSPPAVSQTFPQSRPQMTSVMAAGAPQLGSLQIASGSGVSGGFGSYAATGNVFQSLAQKQSVAGGPSSSNPQPSPQLLSSSLFSAVPQTNPNLFKMRK